MIFQTCVRIAQPFLNGAASKGSCWHFASVFSFLRHSSEACRHIQLLDVEYVCCELADVRKYFFHKTQRMFLNRTETSQVITAFTYRTYIVFTCQRREMLLQKNINVLTKFLNIIINEEITRYSCPRYIVPGHLTDNSISKLFNHYTLFPLVTSVFSDLHGKMYKTCVIRINQKAEDLRLNYNSVPKQWTVWAAGTKLYCANTACWWNLLVNPSGISLHWACCSVTQVHHGKRWVSQGNVICIFKKKVNLKGATGGLTQITLLKR